MLHTSQRKVFRVVVLLSLVVGAISVAVAQDQPLRSITYRLAMSRPVSHLFEVEIEVELADNASAESLDFQMPKWSPGRYAVFDFAKNVQQFYAVAGICPPKSECDQPLLTVTRLDDQTWRVPSTTSKSLTVTYKVFGNDLSGTFSQLDSRHANFNGGCVFMYVVNHKQDPVSLSIKAPRDWRIVNGRMNKKEQTEWQFPNWDILIDTPTEIAPDWSEDDFN